nr:hypothetical protein [Tanacetum cinerariifolium]
RDADRSRNGDNSNDSGTGGRRQMTTLRECSYTDFLKCQPMSFQGTEGVVGLTQWLEKMESVFQISNCTVDVRAIGQDVAYAMPWAALKRMITDKYCPRGEIQKLESEYWNLKGSALTWWNSHMRTVGQDVAYAMLWAALKRMITEKYCPRGEICWDFTLRDDIDGITICIIVEFYSIK